MKFALRLAIASFALPLSLVAQETTSKTPRAITIDDFFAIRDVSQPEISPDGQWIAYAVRMRMLKEDKNEQRVWMIPTNGGDAIPMTAEGISSGHARWSPDGKYLSFLSARDGGKSQVWLLDRRGGEAVRLTDTVQGVDAFEWSPDSTRLVLIVRDSYWLQAIWSVTRHSVKRAEAALAEQWHTAGPVLRLLEVDGGHTTSTAERVTREIEVHGGVTNWYIEVNNPPHSYRVELGYKAANGRFFSLCRSNIVHTPAPDSSDVIDENWTDVAENYERVYALSGGYAEDNQSGELQELSAGERHA